MKLSVQLFARARDLAGADRVEVELPVVASVGALRAALRDCVPALGAIADRLFVAVNNDYADDATVLKPGDEVACFPPVSGG